MPERIGVEYYINIAKFKNEAANLLKEVDKLNRTIESASKKVADTGKAQAKATLTAEEQLKKMGITAKTTSKELRQMNFTALEWKKISELTAQQLKETQAQFDGTGRAAKKLSDKYDRLSKRVTVANMEVNRQAGHLGDAQRAMERWSVTGMKAMMASQAAWITSGSIIFGALGMIATGLRDIISYHQSLKRLQAITQATSEDLALMASAIRDASVATRFFAGDMAKAAVLMAQAGFSAEEVSKSIYAVALLASATGNELEDVADLMTTTLRAYDMDAERSIHVANVFAAAIGKSKLQIDKLKIAMNYMGVAAHQFGISLEDTVSWLGVLSDRGMKASTIGTSFRGVLATLVQETDKFSKVLAKLDTPLGFSDVTIRSGRKLEDALKALAAAGFDVTDSFQAVQRRTAAALSLMVKNIDAWEDLKNGVTDTSAAFEMNKIMMEGLESQFAQIKSIFDELMISFTRSGGALEIFAGGFKLILQLLSYFLINFSLGLNLIGKFTAAVLALGSVLEDTYDLLPSQGVENIGARILRFFGLGSGFKSQYEQAEVVVKAFAKDIVKITEDAYKSLDRISGGGTFFGAILPTSLKDLEETYDTIVKINQKIDSLKARRAELDKGSEDYKKITGELMLLNVQLDEMAIKAGFAMDQIMGPVKQLHDVLNEMVMGPEVTLDQLVTSFRKGKDNVEVLRKAVGLLKIQAEKALEKMKETGDVGGEYYKRLIAAVKAYVEALNELEKAEAKLEKARARKDKAAAKEEKEREKAIDKLMKAYNKVAEDLVKLEDKIAKDRAKILDDSIKESIAKAKQEFAERQRLVKELVSQLKLLKGQFIALMPEFGPEAYSEFTAGIDALLLRLKVASAAADEISFDKPLKEIGKEVAKVEKKIIQINRKTIDELKELTLSEVEYTKWAANEEAATRLEKLNKLKTTLLSIQTILNDMEQTPEVKEYLTYLDGLIAKLKETEEAAKQIRDETLGRGFAEGLVHGFKEVVDKMMDTYTQAKRFITDIAAGMQETFSDMYYDAMVAGQEYNRLKEEEDESHKDRLEDIERTYQRRVEDIQNAYYEDEVDRADDLAEAKKDYLRDVEDAERDHADALDDIHDQTHKGLKDYWEEYLKLVKRAIAEMVAEWSAAMVMMAAKKAALGIAGQFGWSEGPYLGSDFNPSHTGGYPSFHPGGQVNTNEGLALLKKKEFVIRDTSAESIGRAPLEYMNRTGNLPEQPAMVDNRKFYVYNDFIDPEGLDKVLRTRGSGAIRDVSLASFAYARYQKDPRVR